VVGWEKIALCLARLECMGLTVLMNATVIMRLRVTLWMDDASVLLDLLVIGVKTIVLKDIMVKTVTMPVNVSRKTISAIQRVAVFVNQDMEETTVQHQYQVYQATGHTVKPWMRKEIFLVLCLE